MGSDEMDKIISDFQEKEKLEIEARKKIPKPILDFKNIFLLIGFSSEIEQINLEGNFLIRKGTDKELERFYKNAKSYDLADSKFVIEYTYRSTYHGYVQSESDDAILLINLLFQTFNNTNVTVPYFITLAKKGNELEYASLGLMTDNKISKFQESIYTLSKEKSIDFKLYWSNLFNLDREKNKTLNITFNRLVYSKTKFIQEDQLLDLMISFESFFVNDNTEISYKLPLRVATFLREFYKTKFVFDFIKKSYNLRSKIIHGSILKPKDLKINDNTYSIKEINLVLRELMDNALNEYVSRYNNQSVSKLIDMIDYKIVE